MQFLENKFKYDSETTIGVEFGSKIVDIDDRRIKMQIWDTVPTDSIVSRQDRKSSNPSRDPIIAAPLQPS
jgi:GTPase SAR1 family protein